MRVALIATGEQAAKPAPVIAGRSLVLRQFDFARGCGIERVIAYGDGTRPDAAALRREAERAGIAYTTISSAHALIQMVDWADHLLVLQPGILPESEQASALLSAQERVLSFPSAAIERGGFERIDAARFWVGALIMPGALVGQLKQLDDDADPHAALLRIALQARIPIEPLNAEVLVDGAWVYLQPGQDGAAPAALRWRRYAAARGETPPSRWVAGLLLSWFGKHLSAARDAATACLAVAMILLGAGLFAAWQSQPWLAFAAIALSMPLLDLAFACDRLARAPFRRTRFPPQLRAAIDCAILVASIFAIEGEWHRQLFPPLVLVAALNSITGEGYWRALVSDRGAGALLVAGAALVGWQEQALMAWALAALAAALVSRRAASAPSETETEQ